jgi:cytochrome b
VDCSEIRIVPARGQAMIKYEYVNKELIVSAAARRNAHVPVAAVVSLTIYFTLAAIVINGPTPLLKQLLFVGV